MYPKVSIQHVKARMSLTGDGGQNGYLTEKFEWDCEDPTKYLSFITYDKENKIIVDIDEFDQQGSLQDLCKFLAILSTSMIDSEYFYEAYTSKRGIWIELNSDGIQQDGRKLLGVMTRLKNVFESSNRYYGSVTKFSMLEMEIKDDLQIKATIKANIEIL